MDALTLAGIGIAVGSAGLGFATWALLEVRRSRAAIALLQGKTAAVLPGMLPLAEKDVARMIAAALDEYRAGADHERALATALLEQMAREILTRVPYDAAQRRLAVEQRLVRNYNRLGATPPASVLERVRRMD